jgi:ferric-dicitrate binding protein FerR (iron transport regulator)
MNRDYFLIVFLLLALPLAWAQAPQQPQPAALPVGRVMVASIKGEVSFKSPAGTAMEAASVHELLPGSVIETAKGSTVLTLLDGSQVQIKPHSRVTLKDPAEENRFSLELFLGKLAAKIQKKIGSTPSFRMGTPTAVITVRGTSFEVEVNKKGRTDVYVYQGIVEVFGLGTNLPPVLLPPGFRTGVEPRRAPEEPRQFMQPFRGDDDRSDRQSTSRSGSGDDSSGRRGSSSGDSQQREQQSSGSTESRDR